MKKAIHTLRTNPGCLLWWQWGKIAGLVLAPLAWLTGNRLCAALGMHVLCDFTLQNNWMSDGKARREFLPLLVHSFIAGALPGFTAGGMMGAVAGWLTHFAIDALALGNVSYVLDQVLHILVIVLIGGLYATH